MLLSSCSDTLNVAGPSPGEQFGAKNFIVEPIDDTVLRGGDRARFRMEIIGGFTRHYLPYSVAIHFGGAAEPNLVWETSTRTTSRTVRLLDVDSPTTFTAIARVTPALGLTGRPEELTFTVLPREDAAQVSTAASAAGTAAKESKP